MMDLVPKKLPYLNKQTTRHGKTVWYVRIRPQPRVRIHGEYGSEEFMSAYRAAVAGEQVTSNTKVDSKSLQWLLTQYRQSSAYLSLSKATRKQRDNIFKHVLAKSGSAPYRAVTKAHIVQGRERRAATPAQARNFLDAMRGLFRWAVEAQFVDVDPTAGVKNPSRPKRGSGFPPWEDDDVLKFYERWPLGAIERVWMDTLLFTGLRRSDVVIVGKQHVRNGVIYLRTEKTDTEVIIPIREPLRATLDAGPTGDMNFVVGRSGNPLTKESFGNMFRAACAEAGVSKSAHGLRKLAATKAAEAGATNSELDAMFGWVVGSATSAIYTKAADRRRLALRGWSEKAAREDAK